MRRRRWRAAAAPSLAISIAPFQIRSMRTSMINVRQADYVVTGRSMGLSEPRLMRRFVRHVLEREARSLAFLDEIRG